MGGVPPYGYRVENRKLMMVDEERGGRKEMVLPCNTPDGAYQHRRTDSDLLKAPLVRAQQRTLVKALARAFRWKQRMLESGEFATIAELADREGIALSYMTRLLLRLTLIAPDIVEVTLDGQQRSEVTLARAMQPFPVEWEAQQHQFPSSAHLLKSFDSGS